MSLETSYECDICGFVFEICPGESKNCPRCDQPYRYTNETLIHLTPNQIEMLRGMRFPKENTNTKTVVKDAIIDATVEMCVHSSLGWKSKLSRLVFRLSDVASVNASDPWSEIALKSGAFHMVRPAFANHIQSLIISSLGADISPGENYLKWDEREQGSQSCDSTSQVES